MLFKNKSLLELKSTPKEALIIPLFLMFGCGARSGSMVQSTNCKTANTSSRQKNPSTPNKSSLLLEKKIISSSTAEESPLLLGDSGIGTGYLDISTRTQGGPEEKKRCTMHLRPTDDSKNVVRIWTAGHCFFDPQTEKFRNSKYTLQIYYNGGYFSTDVTFKGFSELVKLSKTVSDFTGFSALGGLPADTNSQLFRALPSGTGKNCLDEEDAFLREKLKKTREQLRAKGQQIACFSREEIRGFIGTLTLNTESEKYMTEVMKILRARDQASLSKIDPANKNFLHLYLEAHSLERRRTADLRSLAYLLNKKICDLYQSNPNSEELIDPVTRVRDSNALCNRVFDGKMIRDLIIEILNDPSKFPAADNAMMKNFYNETNANLGILRQQTNGCHTFQLDSLNLKPEELTPCDWGNISVELWSRWVDTGAQFVTTSSFHNSQLFGMNQQTYFSLATNAAQKNEQKTRGEMGRARILPLNPSSVLQFGNLVTGKSNNTMLIHFDSTAQNLFLGKGDSGAMLSVFGHFPAGLLSTVDGNKTSGGATIMPLPQVGPESDVEAEQTLPAKNSDCR